MGAVAELLASLSGIWSYRMYPRGSVYSLGSVGRVTFMVVVVSSGEHEGTDRERKGKGSFLKPAQRNCADNAAGTERGTIREIRS